MTSAHLTSDQLKLWKRTVATCTLMISHLEEFSDSTFPNHQCGFTVTQESKAFLVDQTSIEETSS